MTPFRVLHVCTGNIARSPMAERYMQHLFDQTDAAGGVDFQVASAGTLAQPGRLLEPGAAAALSVWGIDASNFRATRLEPPLVAAADLVLTAELEHRRQAVAMVPAAVRRTFTLKEFTRLLRSALGEGSGTCAPTPGDPAGVVAQVVTHRGYVDHPPVWGIDDLEDPYGGPPTEYVQRFAEIRLAVAPIVTALVAAAGGRRGQSPTR